MMQHKMVYSYMMNKLIDVDYERKVYDNGGTNGTYTVIHDMRDHKTHKRLKLVPEVAAFEIDRML